MELVDPAQQCWVHVRFWELSLKLPAPFDQAQADLLPQGPGIQQPCLLVLFQEPEAPPLPLELRTLLLELLQKWFLPNCNCLEPLHIQFSDPVGRDAKDSAEHSIRDELLMVCGGDQLAKF